MEYCILCKNGRRIYVGGVTEDNFNTETNILRLTRGDKRLFFNFDNILAYGLSKDMDTIIISETRL